MTLSLPPIQNRIIPTNINTANTNVGRRVIRGVTYHRMLGSLWGTDAYFRDTGPDGGADKGLTDYGVDAMTGETLQWNDTNGFVTPYASGPYEGAYGDGQAFEEKYGPITGIGKEVINRDRASIEISNGYDDPWSHDSMLQVAKISAYHAQQYGIKAKDYPIAPWDGFSFVAWHQEFCLGSGKICPGNVVMSQTDEVIKMTADILAADEANGTTQPIPSGQYQPIDLGLLNELKSQPVGYYKVFNKGLASEAHVIVAPDIWISDRGVTPYKYAVMASGRTGPDYHPGEPIHYLAVINTNTHLWLLTMKGERVKVQ